MPRAYTTFAAFWPFYLREHSKPRTRALHYVGTSLVVAIAMFAAATGRWWWMLALPVAGYFFAWIAHFGVEKKPPRDVHLSAVESRGRFQDVVAVADRATAPRTRQGRRQGCSGPLNGVRSVQAQPLRCSAPIFSVTVNG